MLNIRSPSTDLDDRYKTLHSFTSILDVRSLGRGRRGMMLGYSKINVKRNPQTQYDGCFGGNEEEIPYVHVESPPDLALDGGLN